MKTLITVLLVSFFSVSHASEIPKKQRTHKPAMWDTLYHKNELSLDVSLPLRVVIGSENFNDGLALTYLRALTKRDLLRISSRHSFKTTYSNTDNFNDNDFNLGSHFWIPDSVITRTYKNYRYYSPDIRVGYEHRFGRRRIKAILGLDVLFGAEVENTSYAYGYLKPEPFTDADGNVNFIISQVEREPQFASSQNINLKEGIAPFGGIFIHLSKRFSLRATAMMDIYWTQSVSFQSDLSSEYPPGNQFKLGIETLVADISLTVHF